MTHFLSPPPPLLPLATKGFITETSIYLNRPANTLPSLYRTYTSLSFFLGNSFILSFFLSFFLSFCITLYFFISFSLLFLSIHISTFISVPSSTTYISTYLTFYLSFYSFFSFFLSFALIMLQTAWMNICTQYIYIIQYTVYHRRSVSRRFSAAISLSLFL